MMLLCLTACAAGHSSALPDVVEYSRNTQSAALKELQTQNVPVLKEFMKDYKVMRDQVRVASQ